MNVFRSRRIGVLALGAFLFSACAGGGGSRLTPPTAPEPASTSIELQTIRLFVPAKSTTRSRATSRKPDYVSYNTKGVEITTSQGSTQLGQAYFSTVPADDTDCTAVGSTGFSCTFVVAALAPSTTFAVSTFSAEPTTSGGVTTDSGSLLSSGGSANVPITAGANNTIGLTLGGIVSSFTISVFANGNTSTLTNGQAISAPAGVPSKQTLSYQAYDASGEQILAANSNGNGSISNGITVAIAEPQSNDTGHLAVKIAGSAAAPAPSVTSYDSADTFALKYDGLGSGATDASAYYATITVSAPAFTDGNGNSAPAPASTTITFAPIYLEAFVPPANASDTFTPASVGPPPSPAAFAYAQQGSNDGSTPTYSRISVVQYAHQTANAETGYAATTTASGCTDFSFPAASPAPMQGDSDYGSAASFDAEYSATPTSGATCAATFGDGYSSATLDASYLATTANGTIGASQPVWVTAAGAAMTSPTSTNEQTFRSILKPSVGSRGTARIHLSNPISGTPAYVGDVHAGLVGSGGGAQVTNDVPVTFGGKSAVTVPAGGSVYSDPFALKFAFGAKVAITTYLPGAQGSIPYHFFSGITQYATAANAGDTTSDLAGTTFSSAITSDLLVDRLDLEGNYSGTVAIAGSSTLEGFGSPVNAFESVADDVAANLHSYGHDDIAIANMSIIPSALSSSQGFHDITDRFSRDFTSLPDLAVIVQGAGDIDLKIKGFCYPASQISTADRHLITLTHQAGAKMLLAYIAPTTYCNGYLDSNGNRFPQDTGQDAERQMLDAWMSSTTTTTVDTTSEAPPGVEAYADISTVVSDPSNTGYLLPQYDSGDHAHLNAAGQSLQATQLTASLMSIMQ